MKYVIISVFVAFGLFAFDGWWNGGYRFNEGRACHWIDGKCGYINRLHQVVIPHIYDNCGDFDGGIAYVGVNDDSDTRYGCIDRRGNIVVPLLYDWCSSPVYGVVHVKLDGKHGCFTTEGRESVPLIYDYIGCFFPQNKGLAVVELNDKYGFVKRNGDVAIPVSYDYCEQVFTDGLVRAQIGGKWGYLDHKGNDVIPFVYDEAGIFKDGKAEVVLDLQKYFIDTDGNTK